MDDVPFRCRIAPNTTTAVVQVHKLMPSHQIEPGDCFTPGQLYGVNEEEFKMVNELLAPEGIRLVRETFG